MSMIFSTSPLHRIRGVCMYKFVGYIKYKLKLDAVKSEKIKFRAESLMCVEQYR